ncbi:MAG: DUF2141 domain-containing protein [Pseudomonadales bacterium]|nr:DUF2141 domain-containing protein [Pseudomonadales bacterium]
MSRIVPLFLALATSAAFAPALVSAETLTITIADIRESEGRLTIQVANSEKGFEFSEDSAAPPPVAISQLAEAGEMTFEVTLPPGIYGARVLHDLNGNGEMDSNFVGMPKEPWAFSNNATGRLGPAKWQDAKFEVSGDTAVEIRLNH